MCTCNNKFIYYKNVMVNINKCTSVVPFDYYLTSKEEVENYSIKFNFEGYSEYFNFDKNKKLRDKVYKRICDVYSNINIEKYLFRIEEI